MEPTERARELMGMSTDHRRAALQGMKPLPPPPQPTPQPMPREAEAEALALHVHREDDDAQWLADARGLEPARGRRAKGDADRRPAADHAHARPRGGGHAAELGAGVIDDRVERVEQAVLGADRALEFCDGVLRLL